MRVHHAKSLFPRYNNLDHNQLNQDFEIEAKHAQLTGTCYHQTLGKCVQLHSLKK